MPRAKTHAARFTATLWRYPGKGGWVFADVPPRHAPPVLDRFGRTPVVAAIGDVEWQGSTWRNTDGRVLLAIPKSVRERAAKTPGQPLAEGARVTISLQLRA